MIMDRNFSIISIGVALSFLLVLAVPPTFAESQSFGPTKNQTTTTKRIIKVTMHPGGKLSIRTTPKVARVQPPMPAASPTTPWYSCTPYWSSPVEYSWSVPATSGGGVQQAFSQPPTPPLPRPGVAARPPLQQPTQIAQPAVAQPAICYNYVPGTPACSACVATCY